MYYFTFEQNKQLALCAMKNEELFEKISDLVKSEMNGKMDAKLTAHLEPVFEEFEKINIRLDNIEKIAEANASNIKSISGDI